MLPLNGIRIEWPLWLVVAFALIAGTQFGICFWLAEIANNISKLH